MILPVVGGASNAGGVAGWERVRVIDFGGGAGAAIAAGGTIERGGITWTWRRTGAGAVATANADGVTFSRDGADHTGTLTAAIGDVLDGPMCSFALLMDIDIDTTPDGTERLLCGLTDLSGSALQEALWTGYVRSAGLHQALALSLTTAGAADEFADVPFSVGATEILGGIFQRDLGARVIRETGGSMPASDPSGGILTSEPAVRHSPPLADPASMDLLGMYYLSAGAGVFTLKSLAVYVGRP